MKTRKDVLLVSAFIFLGLVVLWAVRSSVAQTPIEKKLPALKSEQKLSITERVAKVSRKVLGHALRARGDAALDDEQANELEQIYNDADTAAEAVENAEDVLVRRRQIKLAWAAEMDAFLARHPGSPFNADICLELGKAADERLSYVKAMSYYAQAWDATKDAADQPSPEMAREAASHLAPILSATGRTAEFKDLEAEAATRHTPVGGRWWWALEIERYAEKHPQDSYKCGLWCLDNLARLLNPNFTSKEIVETESSTNGFTLTELVDLENREGVSVNAVSFGSYTNLPLPAVLHLKSEHFVVAVEQNAGFFTIKDPLTGLIRSLTADELADEGTGCAIISQNQVGALGTQVLSRNDASRFRGRCHTPAPYDHEAPPPCPPADDPDACCPPGSSNPPPDKDPSKGPPGKPGNGSTSPGPPGKYYADSGTSGCCGMVSLEVQEPYLIPWIIDTPLVYKPGNGPTVQLTIAHDFRRWYSNPSGAIQGASIGESSGCSWLSWVEYADTGTSAEVMLPNGSWAKFTFTGGSSTSDVNYRQNLRLE